MIPLNAASLLFIALTPATSPAPFTELPVLEAPAQPIVLQDADVADEPKWTGSANAGATLNTGNTETVAIAASIDAELRRAKDRQTIGAYWNYAENDDVTTGVTSITERKAGADYQYDYFINEKTYYLANAGARTDDIARLDLRWFAGAGIGRQIFEEEDHKLSGEVGLVYLEESYETSSDDSEGVSVRVASSYLKRLTKTTVFEVDGEIFQSLKEGDDVYGRLDARIRLDVHENLFAMLQWIIDWDNTPASGSTSTDQQIIATLGWGF